MSVAPALLPIEGTLAAFEQIGIAAALLGRSGCVLAANPGFTRHLPPIGHAHPSGLRLHDRTAAACLAATLSGATSAPAPIRLPRGRTEYGTLHLVPLAPQPPAPPAPSCLLLLHIAAPSAPPSAPLIRQALCLTHTKARFAHILAAGKTLAAAATTLQTTHETARTHLKHIFQKTNTHRQADLVRLVYTIPTSAIPPAPPSAE